ncbi:glycosyltransferase, partial [Candidatus Peregrinibacteria bacterium]|nr:glycosyltransferase [Candidatus Peregrinibacteria bacterium]
MKTRNLIYCSIFLNKDYFALLKLFIKSLKKLGNIGANTDILVLTSKEFEPKVKKIFKKNGLSVITYCLDIPNTFASACTRLFIFDYPEIHLYDKILYLDVDIIVAGNLNNILDLDIENKLYVYNELKKIEDWGHGKYLFKENEYEIDFRTEAFSTCVMLFNNCLEIKKLFADIIVHINYRFPAYIYTVNSAFDQDFVIYHCFKNDLYNNTELTGKVINSPIENNGEVIAHFPIPCCDSSGKKDRMKKYLNFVSKIGEKTHQSHSGKTRVAFLTGVFGNPYDKRSWSGALYYMRKALEHEFDEVVVLTTYKPIINKIITIFTRRLNKTCIRLFGKKSFSKYFSKLFAWYYASGYSKKIKNGGFDLIVAPNVHITNKLKSPAPIFHINDSTFKNLHNYYSVLSNLMNFCIKECNKTTFDTIHNSDALIYSSDWATQSAIDDYSADEKKVHTIPFGANIDKAPDISKINNRDLSGTCNLLFLGSDWERKGGDIALDTLNKLLEQQMDVKLTVVGHRGTIEHQNVEQISFLDKNDSSDYKKYEELMYDAHFLLMPTRAECYGIVYCDASAYGVPSITTDTGGVPTVVKNEINGYTLPYEATGKEYAKVIGELWGDKEKYR